MDFADKRKKSKTMIDPARVMDGYESKISSKGKSSTICRKLLSELLVKHRESQSPFVLVFPDPLVSLIVRKRHS